MTIECGLTRHRMPHIAITYARVCMDAPSAHPSNAIIKIPTRKLLKSLIAPYFTFSNKRNDPIYLEVPVFIVSPTHPS